MDERVGELIRELFALFIRFWAASIRELDKRELVLWAKLCVCELIYKLFVLFLVSEWIEFGV